MFSPLLLHFLSSVSSITSCPADLSTPASISSGTHKFGRSDTLCILTKAIPDAADGSLSSVAPVALSYDSGDWDKAAGVFAMSLLYGLEFGNYPDGSQITLPALTGDEQYYLTSYARDNVSDTDKIAVSHRIVMFILYTSLKFFMSSFLSTFIPNYRGFWRLQPLVQPWEKLTHSEATSPRTLPRHGFRIKSTHP